jgi:hypothetical protein
MLTSGELISVAAGAALAVLIGLRKPPPLISALLLMAIALLGLGLAYALGALAAVGVYVLIMDIGYVAGLTASLVRELMGGGQRRAVAEVGGLLTSEARIRKISSNGGVVEVTVFEGRIAPIYMDRGPIEEVAAALSTLASVAIGLMKNGQVIKVKLGRESEESPVKVVSNLGELSELTQLLVNRSKVKGPGEISSVKLGGRAILVYRNGKLAYIIPINQ